MHQKKHSAGKALIIVLIVIAVLLAAAIAAYFIWEQAPLRAEEKNAARPAPRR